MEKDRPAFDTLTTGASVASAADNGAPISPAKVKASGFRELDTGEFSASEMASIRPYTPPAGWKLLPWYKRPFIVAWVFISLQWGYVQRIAVGLRWAIQRWLKSRPGALLRGAEIMLWPLFFVYLGWVSNISNPFYINEGFPWPWVGVWLIALRYGALSGAIAALILLASWYLLAENTGGGFPRLYFLGGAIMTMIAGEFGSLWGMRMARFREATRYQDDKIERLTRRLYLLKLSHDELEYELVDRPGTLRDSLQELRGKLTPETMTGGDKLPGSRALLQFLAQYGHIEAGAIYEYIDGPKPVIRQRAEIGEPSTPDVFDPMLRRAIETGQSVHLQEHLVDDQRKSAMLLVAPIADAKERPIGVLVVNRMPFMALNPDNLRNIWVLLQSYTEYLRLSSIAQPYTDAWPDSPMELRHEFAWLQRLQLEFGLQSWCALWSVHNARAPEMVEEIRIEHRSGEMCWVLRHGLQYCVVSLLPFQGIAQVKVQQKRITTALVRSFGQERMDESLTIYDISLAKNEAWTQLKQLVQRDDGELAMGAEE